MGLIAEYDTQLTQLLDTLQAVPTMTVRHDEIYFTPDRSVKWIFWACGEQQSEFEAALDTDPTVEQYRVTAEIPHQRLYSVTLVGSPEDFTLSVFNELDIQILDATHSYDGTTVRVRCPSRETLSKLRETIEAKYGKFVVRRLYREETSDMSRYSVTEPQREALLCALEHGHFEVPRRSDLRTVASKLGISDQALSSRLRRGTATLLRDTLAQKTTNEE
ncbi:helix-turn-helix domain-containing protein [Halogranum rubrum]|uniref:Bacterio-opsin activator HTH domain-containing protein n=1 Tax=Halogranum salarium B-1 TaxID=1210908 RepID=J3A3I6_9EURY|nr:helix-turn-helix domain-containing protein [Halogranum salarium]EJN59958.1 hypothetical protein HSB1_21160 [Halogranum salarium B-1]